MFLFPVCILSSVKHFGLISRSVMCYINELLLLVVIVLSVDTLVELLFIYLGEQSDGHEDHRLNSLYLHMARLFSNNREKPALTHKSRVLWASQRTPL